MIPWSTLSVLGLLLAAGPLRSQVCEAELVPRATLVRAMANHGDYDILATTNRGRFTTELLLELSREAHQRNPHGPPIIIDPDDWFAAYLETAQVTAEQAPLSARLGHENRQWVMIEHRLDRVISGVGDGPSPELAVNVRAWWPKSENPASQFSFEDTAATPRIKVTSQQEVTYRLLDFDDMVVIDEMEGLSARPTTGILGALFRVVGEASLKQSRIAVSDDGVQVVRTRSSRLFSVSVTVTINPDGEARRGIPDDRPDLQEIERQLKRKIEIDFVPTAWGAAEYACQPTDS